MTHQVAAARDMDDLVYRLLLPVSILFVALRIFLMLHSAAGPAVTIISRAADFLGTLPS